MIGALGLIGVVAPLTYKGTLNGLLFAAYVEKSLAAAMKKGDMLIKFLYNENWNFSNLYLDDMTESQQRTIWDIIAQLKKESWLFGGC